MAEDTSISLLHKELASGTIPDFITYQKQLKMSSPLEVAMSCNRHGDNSLHVAARHGSLNALIHIHESLGMSLVHVNNDGKTALHEAVQHSHLHCAEYLLREKSPVDSLKMADWTPLMLACTKDSIDMVQLLLSYKASLELRNKDGWTPFHIACRRGVASIVSLLLDTAPECWNTISYNGRTPLHTVALHGNIDILTILHERCGYDINVTDSCGVTPLMDAVRCNHLKVAQLLIKYGADVTLIDLMSRGVLHHGAQAGSLDTVKYLLDSANAEGVNLPAGVAMTTPLHYAAKEGQFKMIELLLSYGADRNAMDKYGRKAIDIASMARSGSEQSVKALTIDV